MADNEIMGMVNPDTLARIKAVDPNPVIKVFGIGHEGKAHAKWANRMGGIVLHYFRDAVVKLFGRLKVGIPAFAGHASSAGEQREDIGEVVGRALKDIKGITHALVAVHLKPEFAKRDFDIASMEANLEFTFGKGGDVRVQEVEEITGIALGNSATEKPAFPGATLLGAMQAFRSKRSIRSKRGGTTHMTEEQGATITEIKEKIRTGKFDDDDLFDLPEEQQGRILQFLIRYRKGQEYEGKKTSDKAKDDAEHELKAVEKALAKSQADLGVLQRKQSFVDLAVSRKLDANQQKYIGLYLPSLKANATELELNKFIDERLKEHQELVKTYGGKSDQGDPDGKPGTPSADRKPDEGGETKIKDYTDPAQNPMIAGGEAAAKAAAETEKK